MSDKEGWIGILRRQGGKGQSLRTDEVRGSFSRYPEVDTPFVLLAKPLHEGSIRMIQTSPVQMVAETEKNKYTFTTMNSVYELEVVKGIMPS